MGRARPASQGSCAHAPSPLVARGGLALALGPWRLLPSQPWQSPAPPPHQARTASARQPTWHAPQAHNLGKAGGRVGDGGLVMAVGCTSHAQGLGFRLAAPHMHNCTSTQERERETHTHTHTCTCTCTRTRTWVHDLMCRITLTRINTRTCNYTKKASCKPTCIYIHANPDASTLMQTQAHSCRPMHELMHTQAHSCGHSALMHEHMHAHCRAHARAAGRQAGGRAPHPPPPPPLPPHPLHPHPCNLTRTPCPLAHTPSLPAPFSRPHPGWTWTWTRRAKCWRCTRRGPTWNSTVSVGVSGRPVPVPMA